jgi:hypothetical protein
VLRYGLLYGPGTRYDTPGRKPALHVDAAAHPRAARANARRGRHLQHRRRRRCGVDRQGARRDSVSTRNFGCSDRPPPRLKPRWCVLLAAAVVTSAGTETQIEKAQVPIVVVELGLQFGDDLVPEKTAPGRRGRNLSVIPALVPHRQSVEGFTV